MAGGLKSAGTGLPGTSAGRAGQWTNLNAGYCECPGRLPEIRRQHAAAKIGVTEEEVRCKG